MAGKKAETAEKSSVVEEPGVLELFSPGERWEMRQTAAAWKQSPDDLVLWLEEQVFFQIQLLSKLASGEKSLPGRTGQNIFYRALKEFNELASEVVKIARTRLEKAPEKK